MLQRFDSQFLRDFRDPITINPKAMAQVETEEAAPPPPPPPPTFSEMQLQDAKSAAEKIGYAKGFEAGLEQGNTEAIAREKDMANALAGMVRLLQNMSNHYQEHLNKQTTEVAELALLIAKKVAEDALDARGADVVAALVTQCLPLFIEKPKIAIELHPDMLDNAKEALKPLLAQHGFEGDVNYRANDTLQKHDVRVDWGNGQATRSMEVLWRDIEALVFQIKPN